MQLDITDGKITRISTVDKNFNESEYKLGTTTKGNFFAAICRGRPAGPEGQLVLIPVGAVTAIYMEVSDAKQQNANKDQA
jgi:hypothetical protein